MNECKPLPAREAQVAEAPDAALHQAGQAVEAQVEFESKV